MYTFLPMMERKHDFGWLPHVRWSGGSVVCTSANLRHFCDFTSSRWQVD